MMIPKNMVYSFSYLQWDLQYFDTLLATSFLNAYSSHCAKRILYISCCLATRAE